MGLKILMISCNVSFSGGEGIYITKLSRVLENGGHRVINLILTNSQYLENKILPLNSIQIKYHSKNNLQHLLSENIINIKVYSEIRKIIISFNPDVIHLHETKLAKTILLASRGIPKIQTFHGISSVFPLYDLFFKINPKTRYSGEIKLNYHKLINIKFRTLFFDFFLFDNNRIKKKIIKYFLCPSKHLTNMCKNAGFKNVIYFPYFQEVYANKPNKINSNYLLFVGRLSKIKGVDLLLKAFKISKVENKNLKLIIVGDGEERKNLIKLSNELGINEHIKFVGWIDNSNLSKYYKNSLAVVIPSIYPEVSPLVAYEAMSFSKPIIGFDIGGLSDLIKDGINGYLINREDIMSMAEKINSLAKNIPLSISMGNNGRKILEQNWSKKRHVDNLIKLYKSIILSR